MVFSSLVFLSVFLPMVFLSCKKEQKKTDISGSGGVESGTFGGI